MYGDVLVPTDGSPGTESAVEHALAIAGRFDATIHAVTVAPADADDRASAVEWVASRVEETGVPVVTAVRRGTPHEELLAYAETEGIDLVVMGTHGRTGLDRRLLGSVTERVLRLGDVPVLAVHLDGGRAVETEAEAVSVAVEAVEAAGHEVAGTPERPYRERATWVVRVEADGDTFNVHVNADTGATRLARIREDA
ncbi:MAG: universal stress protein [Halobacteriaceae archaeon]